MSNDLVSTYVAFLVFGLLALFTNEKYLKNVIASFNKFRILKLEPILTVRLIKIFAKGFLVIGVIGIVSYIFNWNSY